MKINMKKFKGLLAFLLVFSFLVQPVCANAEETDEPGQVEDTTEYFINPIYSDIYTLDDLKADLAAQEQTEELSGEILGDSSSSPKYNSLDDAIAYFSSQMVVRSTSITFSLVSSITSSWTFYDLYYGSLEYSESCSGQEGDALRFSVGGMSVSSTYNSSYYQYTFKVTYYTTSAEEEQLTEAVDLAMTELDLDGLSEERKIKKIHDYVCDHVDYYGSSTTSSEINDDPDYTTEEYLKYTAYAALCKGGAVCQGYAILFYRLAKEAGLSARIVSGYGSGGKHAWNIVRVGNYYYDIDTTWDGQTSETHDTYLLKCEVDFADHTRENATATYSMKDTSGNVTDSRTYGTDYTSAEFYSEYPMAPNSWGEVFELLNKDNLSYSFTTVNGTTVTSAASGKPKLLVFFKTTCPNSQSTLSEIAGSSGFGNIDVIALSTINSSTDATLAETNSFASTYGSNNITYCYSTSTSYNLNAMWAYYHHLTDENSVMFPLCIYIDADNKIQAYSTGAVTANGILNTFDTYCSGGIDYSMCGYSLSLMDDGYTKLNSYWSMNDDFTATDAYMVMSSGDDEYKKTVAKASKSSDGKYRIFSYGVATADLGKTVTYSLYSADGELLQTYKYSPQSYLYDFLDKYEDGELTNSTEAQKQLAISLLNYGTMAQKYLGTTTLYDGKYSNSYLDSASASSFVSTFDSANADGQFMVKYCKSVGLSFDGLEYYGTSLVLNSSCNIRHYFTLEDGCDISDYTFFTVESTSTTYSMSSEKVVHVGGNLYYVELTGKCAGSMSDDTTLSISKKGTNSSTTLTYSIYNYIAKVIDANKNENLIALCKALYGFDVAGQAVN